MSGLLWGALGVLGGLGMTAIGDMVSEEVRDRLDHVPHTILRLAARRIDPAQRLTVYDEEWLPELTYILKGDEARPISRLIHGTWYALGILAASGRISAALQSASENTIPRTVTRRNLTPALRNALVHGLASETAEAVSVAVSQRRNGTVRRRVFISLSDGSRLQMSHEDFESMLGQSPMV